MDQDQPVNEWLIRNLKIKGSSLILFVDNWEWGKNLLKNRLPVPALDFFDSVQTKSNSISNPSIPTSCLKNRLLWLSEIIYRSPYQSLRSDPLIGLLYIIIIIILFFAIDSRFTLDSTEPSSNPFLTSLVSTFPPPFQIWNAVRPCARVQHFTSQSMVQSNGDSCSFPLFIDFLFPSIDSVILLQIKEPFLRSTT